MIDLQKHQPLLTPLAIFLGCVVIAAAIYGSGGIRIGSSGTGGQPSADDSAVAGESADYAQDEEPSYDSAILEAFAKCLTERGAKVYVSSTCGYCAQQKQRFGEAIQYIDQVECYDEATEEWSQACDDAGIQGVPTWILSDGSQLTGLQSLQELSEKTGCPLD